MKTAILSVLFVVAAGLGFGQTVSIDYVEGKVEALVGSKWTRVSPGSAIAIGSSVRLVEGSLLEFNYDGANISIVEPGTYNLQAVISSSKEVKSWDLLGVIGGKIAKTFGKSDDNTGNSALGVRGDKADAEGVDWAYEDDDSDQLELAKTLLDEKKFKEAIKLLSAYSEASDSAASKRAKYFLAYAYTMTGETAIALQQVNKSSIGAEDPFYPDYVLLKGKLLMESLSYRKALGLFNDFIGVYPAGGTAQTVLILKSFCYKGLGDKAKQKESLEQAQKLDPGSPEGAQAAKMLKSLKT